VYAWVNSKTTAVAPQVLQAVAITAVIAVCATTHTMGNVIWDMKGSMYTYMYMHR